MADSGHRCIVPDCTSNIGSLHTLPKEPKIRQAWLMFIFNWIPHDFNSRLLVCSAHFTSDSFSNLGQYQAGFAKHLILKKGAVPSLLPTQPQTPASTSQKLPSTKDVGCQTDPPNLTSLKMLKTHFQSKGIQANLSCQSRAVDATTTAVFGTKQQPLTLIPLKASGHTKRPCLELAEEEVEDVSRASTNSQDSTYEPAQSVTTKTESPQISGVSGPSHRDAKFIVFEQCLLSLFETCPVCTRICNVQPRRRGTFLAIDQLCSHCGFFRQWRSQPVIGSTPVGDLQLSAAIYFSGVSFLKMLKVFQAMHLKTHSYDSFRRHSSMYIEPAIVHKWKHEQKDMLHHLSQQESVIVGGDLRADLSGHSAEYGSYTVMHLPSNNIIDIQLVQSSKVGGSYHMEKEGLKRSLNLLEESGVKLTSIIIDSHPQIQKLLKDFKIHHHYDIWHMAKRLSKKLDRVGREKDCSLVKKWHRSIINHLYWSATTSDSGPEKVAKWTSLVNHIQDVHTHSDPLFPKCLHEPRVSKDRSKWFKPGSTAINRLHVLLTNKRALSKVKNLSPHYQTSTMESFYRAILRFAPKNAIFPFTGRLCKLYLAAMHFNENSDRLQLRTSKEKLVYKLLFPKAKKRRYTFKPVKTNTTFCYVANLMSVLFDEVAHDPLPYVDVVQRVPVP